MKIDPDGIRISGALLCAAAALLVCCVLFGGAALKWAAVGVFLTCLCSVYFFRDPERHPPDDEGIAVSAADGLIVDVGMRRAGDTWDGEALRIAVFMSIFDVHVNRSPVDGVVTGKKHCDGKKISAYNKRAEYENEHGDTEVNTASGPVRIRQIAGIIARRVVTRVSEGNTLRRGDRIGLIRFGSRVDVFLPLAYEPTVEPGDHVRAGETVIARLKSPAHSGTGGLSK
jgi:phosphatidylserine decarboxylase